MTDEELVEKTSRIGYTVAIFLIIAGAFFMMGGYAFADNPDLSYMKVAIPYGATALALGIMIGALQKMVNRHVA